MASIQRIAANAIQLNPEANFSLFHTNFDLALFKCPAELVPLGERLSRHRRELAEEGSFHILARRLGVLFEDVLPKVPSLLKAYGTRASEIARELDKAGSPSKSIADGIFGPHLGIDSTSIWAGATSGSSALLMHLLACMLARIWSPQEATAIWTELVDQRRQAVKNQGPENDRASSIFAWQAAHYDTGWSSLQGWDASARAWLQIADNSSFKGKQKQVELIANNLSVAIQTQVTPDGIKLSASGKTIVGDSVIHNFCTALSTLDNLVAGKPQRVLDGGVLLGLTSWHLYPDLVLLGPKTLDRPQEDPLVAQGGIATLSIAYHEDPYGRQDGVYWSLPLSCLRYYRPVQCKRSSLHDSKISFSELQALILGASLDSLDDLSAATDILQSLWAFNYSEYQDSLRDLQNNPTSYQFTDAHSNNRPQLLVEDLEASGIIQNNTKRQLVDVMHNLHLLSPLVGGIGLFRSNSEEERNIALQLIKYGSNCGKLWIGNVKDKAHPPFFGVTDLSFILQTIKQPLDRVRVLRETYQAHCCEPEGCIIRFKKDDGRWGYETLQEIEPLASRKRSRSQFERDVNETLAPDIPINEEWVFLSSKADTSFVPALEEPWGYGPPPVEARSQDYVFTSFLNEEPMTSTTVAWDFLFGIHNLAAVYIRRRRLTKDRAPKPIVPLPVVQRLVKEGRLDLQIITAQVAQFLGHHRPDHRFSLLALGRVIDHYKHELSHITLSMSVIKEPPPTWAWASSVVKDLELQHLAAASLARNGIISESIYPSPLTRQQAFAAILQFESSTLSVDVHEMDQVMAISSGNSLFIAQRILHDPIPPPNMPSCAVAHAIGNVGKPGIALLFAPEQPMVREHDVEKWHVVNHNRFDGNSSGGSFEASSLHMSFTGWEGPLRVRGPSAFRGMEAYNLETRISMYDQAEWVADLNIFKSLGQSPDLRTCGVLHKKCSHDPSISACGVEFVSIDCWEELLSPADEPMILRSGSSWMVRLTGVSIAFSKGFKCFLLPVHKSLCWTCVVEEAGVGRLADRKVLFVY